MRNSEDKPEWSQRFSLVFQTAKCILHILKQLSIVCLDFCFTIFDGVLKNNTSSVQTSLEKPLILKTTLFCHCYIFFNLRIKHLQTGQMYLHVWITLLLIVLLRQATEHLHSYVSQPVTQEVSLSFITISVLEGHLYLTSIHLLVSIFQPKLCCMLSVFSQPGFVNERITSPSLHKQLSSKLMCPGVPCSALAVLEIYTRDLFVAETSQYPAGVEDIGTQEHFTFACSYLMVFVPKRLVILAMA